MDKTRSLPPLVRGRVTEVFEFFVDKIKFFRNFLYLTDNFDLVLQVQWWGESLPALIRPKELQIEDRIFRNSSNSCHCENYEIKTTSELFESYLKTCEVLELSVLEAVKSCIIGSAFLRNTVNLLQNHNKFTTMPIFDYLGEEIGELIIHVNFLENQEKPKAKQNKNNQLYKCENLDRKSKKYCDKLSNTEADYFSLGEKILLYNSSNRNDLVEDYCKELKPQKDWFNPIKNKRKEELDLKSLTEMSKPLGKINFGKKSSSESLPKIKILSDSSKVLYFGLSKPASDIKNTKIKAPNKFSSNSIRSKSKSKFSSDQSQEHEKKLTKTIKIIKTFSNRQLEEKQFDPGFSSSNKSKELEVLSRCKTKYPSKETSTAKVLDYLFGCDMNEDTEERALNDFKTMSPSHHLVDSISQLCLLTDQNSLITGKKTNESLQETCLNFDFDNPIERDYYEKFFNKPNPSDFEMAEFLNQPENSSKLGRPKTVAEKSPVCNYTKFSLDEEITKNSLVISDKAKNCGRCRYFKKLSELDSIIESLKRFEQKIILHEKNLQNSDLLINKPHFTKGS